jgi:hypothetical protein
MKKLKLTAVIFILFFAKSASSQIIDVDYTYMHNIKASGAESSNAPQFLKSGYVDFLTDGNIQASANLLRINIGDKNGFYLPFFIYTGVAGNAFGSDSLNSTTVTNLLNPIGGTINLSFNGLQNLTKSETVWKLKFAYQVGGRLLNGKDSLTQANFNFFNGFGNIGFFLQAPAWTPDDPSNMGIFYVQTKFISSISTQDNYQKLFGPQSISSSFLLGYSIDAGIEINQVIDVKLGIYQYVNEKNVSLLKNPVVKFSLNYSTKK